MNPLSHVGQTAHPELSSSSAVDEALAGGVVQEHLGVSFRVNVVRSGDLFVGRFALLNAGANAPSGIDDSYRPATDSAWATPAEAITYATEAAHHAIEGIEPFSKGQPGT